MRSNAGSHLPIACCRRGQKARFGSLVLSSCKHTDQTHAQTPLHLPTGLGYLGKPNAGSSRLDAICS